jgi:hypothetical protein
VPANGRAAEAAEDRLLDVAEAARPLPRVVLGKSRELRGDGHRAGFQCESESPRSAICAPVEQVRYRSFQYQAASWNRPRRVIAKVEHHLGELFPRVGFIVTTLTGPNRAVVLSLPFSRSRYFAGPAAAVGLLGVAGLCYDGHPARTNLFRAKLPGSGPSAARRTHGRHRQRDRYTQREASSYAAWRV